MTASELAAIAANCDSPHLDVGRLLGGEPLLVGVDDLHAALAHAAGLGHDLPSLSVGLAGKRLALSKVDGGAVVTLGGSW